VTQFGPTAEIYRRPMTLTAARVFSDPPINAARATKTGLEIRLDTGVAWTMTGEAAALQDGIYTVAVRPHHVTPVRRSESDVALSGVVQVTELSGSESTAHFALGVDGWVSQAHGVHAFEIGENHQFFMDASNAMYFASDGSLAA